jgi:large subunit ribosomal protein L27
VIPGNIIYKQRGTIWHAGENAILGRDFTIHAGVAGYVKYYRDPEVHPTRQFIGVALQRTDSLPYPKDQPRQRKLAKIAVPRREPNVLPALSASNLPTMVSLPPDGVKFVTAADATVATDAAGNPLTASDKKARTQKLPPQTALAPRQLYLRDDYSYRESNWQLGRIAGEVGKQIGGRRGFSRSAVYRTKKKKKSVKIQRVRETAAERRKGFEAAAKKEKARKAQVEAQAVEDMKRSEERFAEMEAAEAAGQLPASKEEEIRP